MESPSRQTLLFAKKQQLKKDENDLMKNVRSITFGACLFCWSLFGTLSTNNHDGFMSFGTNIQPAFATETTTTTTTKTISMPDTTSIEKPAKPVESNLGGPMPNLKKEKTIVDEAWQLINKFYIDKTFNGQDWNQVKVKFDQLSQKDINNVKYQLQLTSQMTKSLGDFYTRILDPRAYEAIQKFDLIGVGVTLMPDETKQIIVGAPPIRDSASDRAGLQVGDYVTAVNGMSTSGRTAFDIIDQISEDPNAKQVTLTVRTEGPDDIKGEGYTRDVTMDRQFQKVSNPIVYKLSEIRSDDGIRVGYIRISEFNALVKTKLEEALVDLIQREKANALVLDLRHNGGGAFQSAVEISGLFMDHRVATYVLDNNQVELPFTTSTGKVIVDENIPVVLWMDSLSASATEVLAASMHDNCRAVIMGDKSFGKGIIQAVYGLRDGAGLVLTVAQYLTPSGAEIQGKGIQPDIQGHLPPPIPGLLSDTKGVDFAEISKRLSPGMCTVPPPHVPN